MKVIRGTFAVIMALALAGSFARAQSATAADTTSSNSCTDHPYANQCPNLLPEKTFYLSNVVEPNNVNEIFYAVRNTLPNGVTVYQSTNQSAIIVRATPDDLARAQKIINDLDRPKKNYRLTYTVTEMDGSKQIGVQHYAMILSSGQQTSLKLGNKIPMVTSTGGSAQTQFTYIDLGMNFDATLTEMGENAMLKSSVDQTSVAPQSSDIEGVKEPIVRQASLKGESLLRPGKPATLGSVDIPGSTSHLNIEVVMEYLP
jgi:hypothetical protein